jgi:hypothetical protein
LIYCSSVSGPVPGFASRSDEMGVAVRIVSYSVTTTTPGTGSSITSMIVSSTGTSTTCLGAFLGAFLAAIFDGRCFLAMGFAAPLTARWTLDLAFFGVVPFAAFLRAGSAPTVLARMGLNVSYGPDGSVHVSQPPGGANVLGRLRFNFPNRWIEPAMGAPVRRAIS